jgi:hypothetical protein
VTAEGQPGEIVTDNTDAVAPLLRVKPYLTGTEESDPMTVFGDCGLANRCAQK